MNALALLKLQQELECIGQNAEGLLVPLPCPNPDTIPRLFVAQHAEGYTTYLRHDLSGYLRQQLAALSPETAIHDPAIVQRILAEDLPCDDLFAGKSYTFPDPLTPADYPDVLPWHDAHRNLPSHFQTGGPSTHLIIADGQIASACESSRENDKAGEAWVQTATLFRRRGYARQVTAAWAHHLQRQGKIPFYSHRWDNKASEAVARSLGLVPFITFVAYT